MCFQVFAGRCYHGTSTRSTYLRLGLSSATNWRDRCVNWPDLRRQLRRFAHIHVDRVAEQAGSARSECRRPSPAVIRSRFSCRNSFLTHCTASSLNSRISIRSLTSAFVLLSHRDEDVLERGSARDSRSVPRFLPEPGTQCNDSTSAIRKSSTACGIRTRRRTPSWVARSATCSAGLSIAELRRDTGRRRAPRRCDMPVVCLQFASATRRRP